MKKEEKIWYAYMMDREDNDWGTGSFSEAEARAWLASEESDDAYIAVIDDGGDPVCIGEIRKEDL